MVRINEFSFYLIKKQKYLNTGIYVFTCLIGETNKEENATIYIEAIGKNSIDVWCILFFINYEIVNFLVPLQLYGEGEYNLNVVTEVDITEGFKSLIGWLNPVKPCFYF